MDLWLAVRYLHLLALAFFVGGQLILAAVVVPVARERAPDVLRALARRFAWGSVVAIVVLAATGSAMAAHFHRWSDPTLHAKLVLVGVLGGIVVWHIRAPQRRALDVAIFAVSLVVVWLGASLAH
ncbi:MAG TPA: hypothetical protein VF549_16485 [Solirubrobacteraceae bacterium]|jgi:uncharacterized membrane protein